MTQKQSIRSLMLILEHAAKFATYHATSQVRPNGGNQVDLRAIVDAAPELTTLGDTIMTEFSGDPALQNGAKYFTPANYTKWEEASAAKIIALLNRLKPAFNKLADEEKTAPDKYRVKNVNSKITASSINGDMDHDLKAEKNPGKRAVSFSQQDPFIGMDFGVAAVVASAVPTR